MSKITNFIRTRSLRTWALAGSLAVVSAASVVSVNAWAEGSDAGGRHGMRCHQMGESMGMMPMGGGRHLERMLSEVKATDVQRQQIKAIEQAAEKDLKALREGRQPMHEQAMALMTQPQIDAVAAEKLRQKMVADHDAMSKRMLQMMLDVAKVLTPEQRAQLAEQMKKRHEKMGHARPAQ